MAPRAHTPAEGLESRLEFEELISDTSAALLAVAPDQVEATVRQALARVRDFFRVDRCALLAVSADLKTVTVRMGAYTEGVPDVPVDINLADVFPWSYQTLLVKRVPVRIERIGDLPADAHAEREAWRQLPIRSALTLPIETAGTIGHVIVLNTVARERAWPDAFVPRLRVLGELLVGALDRQALVAGLREAEAQVSLAADSAGAGLWTLDYGTGHFWATNRARKMFGYTLDEMIGLDRLEASVHPDDRAAVRGAIARAQGDDRLVSVEYRIVLPGGGVRWIASRGRRRVGAGTAPVRLMGVSVDITERMRAQEALRSSEARLAAGVDLAGLAFYEVDFGRGTTFIDDRFRNLCGVPADREDGLGPLEFWLQQLHPDDRPRVLEARAQMHDGRRERIFTEYRFLNPVAGLRWIQHVGRIAERDADGRAVRSYGVLRDITRHRTTEEALRDLGRRLIRAHEEERALLARELHDDVTQRLAALAIDVGRATHSAPDPAQAQALRTVSDGLSRISEDIHTLAYHLHPSILAELGLAAALRAECERRARGGGLEITATLDPVPAGLDRDSALCLFRVAQEALSNVIRHAAASAASVTLRCEDGGLRLTVRDDGVGFDPAAPGVAGSLGLLSMRERVQLANGTFALESATTRGTAVIAWVPLMEGTP